MKALSDLELIRSIAEQNSPAFRELMERYQGRIYNYLRRLLGNNDEALDLTQEVFLSVYEAAPRFQPKAQVKTWLFHIARNAALNELKSARRRLVSSWESILEDGYNSTMPFSFPSADPDPEQSLLRKEAHAALASALHRLPEQQQSALLLKEFEELSYQEIAQILKISHSAVESLIFRARQGVRQHILAEHKKES